MKEMVKCGQAFRKQADSVVLPKPLPQDTTSLTTDWAAAPSQDSQNSSKIAIYILKAN